LKNEHGEVVKEGYSPYMKVGGLGVLGEGLLEYRGSRNEERKL
jgi:hypothetical protein